MSFIRQVLDVGYLSDEECGTIWFSLGVELTDSMMCAPRVKALAMLILADLRSSRATTALRTYKSESSHLLPSLAARPTSLTVTPVCCTPTSGFKLRYARAAHTGPRLGLIAAGSASTLDDVIDFVSDLFDGN
jgi:hypothetical protein